jgi:hypothetical protein
VCTQGHASHAWENYSLFVKDPGPIVIGAAPMASCFGPAYETAMILDTDLRKRKIRDRVPMTYVTSEPYIGHMGLGGVGDSKGLMESELRQRHIKWITNAKITEVKPNEMHVKVGHLHGYAPRRVFNLEGIHFVFSMSQYLQYTSEGRRNQLIDLFLRQFLFEPTTTLLYIGCSFEDSAMNELLMETHRRFPYREQFALLRLPEALRRSAAEPSVEALREAAAPHRARGVEPIWFREFGEIPTLLRSRVQFSAYRASLREP